MVRVEVNQPSLRQAAEAGGPVEVYDPATGRSFVLIPAEQYRALRGAAGESLDPRTAYPWLDVLLAEDDAHDPLLNSYPS